MYERVKRDLIANLPPFYKFVMRIQKCTLNAVFNLPPPAIIKRPFLNLRKLLTASHVLMLSQINSHLGVEYSIHEVKKGDFITFPRKFQLSYNIVG